MPNDTCPTTYDALTEVVDDAIADLKTKVAVAREQITVLDAQQAALGNHPNYAAYCHAGVIAVRGMGLDHILAHAGFYRLSYPDAIDRLAEARAEGDNDCLIAALRSVCESDPLLEISGRAWCEEQGLLKRGALDPYWLRRPLLGLGQPAKLAGLEPRHAASHRGLYTLSPLELGCRFAAVTETGDDTFGDLLLAVIDTGGTALAAIGAEAIKQDAAEHYEADCAQFAAHQRNNANRRWRWKPALSRQGHLAATTAHVRAVDMPAERTRGHAANWLDDHGANPRFRGGDGK